MLLHRKECALIIIDAQEKLMPVISGKEEVTANLVRLVKFSRLTQIPIVVTEQEKLGGTIREIADLLPEQRFLKKLEFNCFLNRDFAAHVKTLKKQNLIIAGVEAHICITQTALSGLENYTIHVVSDAVASRAPYNKKVALQRVQKAGATITTTEMFMYEILQKAGTDEFKSVLPLVK
ncbi:MAG TPA: isochorismatase family protein [Syntrophorhabdaceae bacterium]|nr:isochorismatase family protein [Syntrophorhabdaceae bacterium]